MRYHRFWIEIVVLGSAVALALALLIATLGAAAGASQGEQDAALSNPSVRVGTGGLGINGVSVRRDGDLLTVRGKAFRIARAFCLRLCAHLRA